MKTRMVLWEISFFLPFQKKNGQLSKNKAYKIKKKEANKLLFNSIAKEKEC